MEADWMNNERMVKRLALLIVAWGCCIGVLRAQFDSCYEFKCDYFEDFYICPIHWYGDTLLVVSRLFDEISASHEASFSFEDYCVYLTINGQKGLFWGNSEVGSWNVTGKEDQRFTIQWDSLFCINDNDTIFKFEFIPYYQEENPYRDIDGTDIFHYYCDMTSYYWTRSEGIIAFEGEWLYVRKDQESLKNCLKNIK